MVKYAGVLYEHGSEPRIVPTLGVGQLQKLTEHLEAVEIPDPEPPVVLGDDGVPLPPKPKTTAEVLARIRKHYVPVIHAALKQNYPDIKEGDSADFVTIDNFAELYSVAVLGRLPKPRTRDSGEAGSVGGQK